MKQLKLWHTERRRRAVKPDSSPLILFLLKKFHHYGTQNQISNGMGNSAQFIVDMLLAEGFNATLVEVIDGNSIDKIVTELRPARVVLEAIWVTPAKMAELKRLHPKIRWTVRVHSEIPFLSQEGMAVKWLAEFIPMGIEIAFNSEQTVDDFTVLSYSAWLPNYYPVREQRLHKSDHPHHVDVGCFGAIRPLKNQLIQAFAAVKYADRRRRKLFFHMNGSRIEQQGENGLKNITALFSATGNELVLHPWMGHDDFIKIVAEMDLCLQVSLSESFNITAADAISIGVPLVGSKAIRWLPRCSQADAGSADSIATTMQRVNQLTVWENLHALRKYNKESVKAWKEWIKRV